MSSVCKSCRIEWNVLANADPLAKAWERFDPAFCPRCGKELKTDGCSRPDVLKNSRESNGKEAGE